MSRDRDFSMSYPSQRWPLDLSGFGVNGNGEGEGGLTVSFVSEEEEKDFVKKYMLDTFYRTAPVPRTIGLVKREFLILVLHQAFLFSFSKTQTETLEQGQPFLDEEIGLRLPRPHLKLFSFKNIPNFFMLCSRQHAGVWPVPVGEGRGRGGRDPGGGDTLRMGEGPGM